MPGKTIWEFLDLKQRTLEKGLKNKWAEILILVIIIPAFIWLLKLAWDQNSRIAALETRMVAFVNAMPELRRGIAAAAINQPFRSALIVRRPIASGEAWEAQIEILDAEEGSVRTYAAKLEKAAKEMLEVNLIGSMKRIDPNALNFQKMQENEREVGIGGESLPPAIDRDASFVSYTEPAEIKSALKMFGFQMTDVRPATGIETWPTLKEALNRWHAKGG